MALDQWASAKLCGMVQGMELWNFRSSSFSTEGATYIPRAAITLGTGPHSQTVVMHLCSFCNRCIINFQTTMTLTCIFRSLSCSSAILSCSTIVFSSANVEFMFCTMLLYTPSMSERLIFGLFCDTKFFNLDSYIPC